MVELKRITPIVIAHLLIGLAICIVYSLVSTLDISLLPPFITPYRIKSSILLFIQYFPSLQVSGILVGYALAFSKVSDLKVERWSEGLFSCLKDAFALSLFLLCIYVILAEGLAPSLRTRNETAITRTTDYREYVSVARSLMVKDDHGRADGYLVAAEGIWKDSEEIADLRESCRLRIAEKQGEGLSRQSRLPDPLIIADATGLTVLGALDISAQAREREDFFTAHYYATVAERLARPDDPNKETAKRAAAEAWNQILQGFAELQSRGDKDLYSMKRQGYEAIQGGDYLRAYYIFIDLKNKDIARQDGKHDPDIERFLELSQSGVLESFFFFDETSDLGRFEASRDIFFTLSRSGGTDVIYIKGVTYSRQSGRDVAYLRDVSFARFDSFNKLQYKMYVPQAKMFAFADDGKNPRPQILLRSVGRESDGVVTRPVVLEGSAPAQDQAVLLLDMPLRDFSLIVSANRGPASMIMTDLFRFSGRGKQYGYDSPVYLGEALTRLADPFLLLILSILSLVAGWRYRLGKDVLFKAWWILVVPLFPLLSLIVIGFIRYLSALVIVAFVSLFPSISVVLTLAFLAVCFAAASMYFSAQRSD